MTDPAILRVIRFDAARDRRGDAVLGAYGLGLLAVAGVILLVASPSDRGAREWELILTITGCAVLAIGVGVRSWRARQSSIYVVVDETGLIWGTDRSRDQSLPWVDIQKIRVLPDPYLEGVMYAFSFEPVAGYVSPGTAAIRDLSRLGVSAYRFSIDTRFGDCPADELIALLASRRPDLPILFGSFVDPA